MGSIVFARVDDRLIHGEIMVEWAPRIKPTTILIIDNVLAADKMMQNVYTMAAPPGIRVKVMDVETASEEWRKNRFGQEQDRIFILFKTISMAKEVIEGGLPIKELNIGSIGKRGKDIKKVTATIAMDENDARMLLDLEKDWKNVEIYFQTMPGQKKLSRSYILEKYFPDLNSVTETNL